MKKAIFHIANILACLICGYVAMQSAFAQTRVAATSCPKPPFYIQIDYQFDWPPVEQKLLMDDFKLKCGLQRDVEWLVGRTEAALKALDFSVTNSSLTFKTETGQFSLRLKTNKDDGQPRSVLFPIKYFEFDDSILSYADITGIFREDETLVLRYALDDSRIRDPNSRVYIQWFRDGQMVKGAQKSRYKLTSIDVGKQLTAFISVQDSHGVVYAQRTIKIKEKVGEVISPPQISGLELKGDAVVGNIISASYAYEDRNKSDKEHNSQFVWLRDDFVIKDASGPSYQIVPQDAGKRISVKVTPRNIRGETGKSITFTMKHIVEDELITLRPKILDEIEHKNEEPVFFKPILLKTKNYHEFPSANSNQKKQNSTELSVKHHISITPELSIHQTSIRKITDMVFHPRNPFTDKFSEKIKYLFLGENISFSTTRIILERLNTELKNANYDSIEAYFPEQLVKDGVLRVQFRKVKNKDENLNANIEKKFSDFNFLIIGAGLVCCI